MQTSNNAPENSEQQQAVPNDEAECEENRFHQIIRRNLEPNFNDNTGELAQELVPDWLSVLLNENRTRIGRMEQDPDATQRLFINPKTVEYLFTICLRLRLPHEVMYISLEIYNKFMIAHINNLWEMVRDNNGLNLQQKTAQWERILSNVSRQVALRALSSIQIASKMHLLPLSLTTQMVKNCLRTLGYAYTDESIQKSEIRVLATINWCGNMLQTPVTYLETFLHNIFQINHHLEVDTKAIWEYSLMILDCVFIHSDEFYKRISMVAHGRQGKHAAKRKLNQLKADYVLLSAGVICTACICVHGTDFISTVIITLQQSTGIPSESISDVYMGIFQTINDHKIDNPLELESWSTATVENITPPQRIRSDMQMDRGKRRKTVTFSSNGFSE